MLSHVGYMSSLRLWKTVLFKKTERKKKNKKNESFNMIGLNEKVQDKKTEKRNKKTKRRRKKNKSFLFLTNEKRQREYKRNKIKRKKNKK